MIHRILLAALTALCSAAVLAADPPTHFLIYLSDGARIDCALRHHPRVVTGDEEITISDDSITVAYPVGMVHKYRLGTPDDEDAIHHVTGTPEGSIEWLPGMIRLSGFRAGTPVLVCDLRGMMRDRLTIGDNGCTVISTSNYTHGVYVVRVDKQSFKFIKR